MALNDAQLATLKAAILAETDAAVVAARTARTDGVIVDFYNANAAGPVKCWRPDIAPLELVEAAIDNLALYDNLTQGKRDGWSLLLALPVADFTRNKIRSAPGKVWANTQRDAILADPGTRNARRIELVLGSSDVTEGSVTAKKCNFYGTVDVGDVSRALNLP